MANEEIRQLDKQDNQLESSINTKDFLIGALIGGIVGATTALFLTPKSGKDIRHDLNAGVQSLKEKTDWVVDTSKIKGTELVGAAKEKTLNLRQNISKEKILSKVKGIKQPIHSEADLEEELVVDDQKVQASQNTNDDDIQKKLEETKKAFDDTEYQLNH